jgi:hypothetical protein
MAWPRPGALDAEDSAMKFKLKKLLPVICFLVLMLTATPMFAHVGSPDVYAESTAGPYKLFIVVRPPAVIPGVAEIEVRSETSGIERIDITPIPLTGEASKHPPTPDNMSRPSSDAQFFTGHLWIMQAGSWQVRFRVSGNQGLGVTSIPLPATAMSTRKMQPGMSVFLAGLGILLVIGMVGIVGAAAREAQMAPGKNAPQKPAYISMAIALAVLVAAVYFGNLWWKAEAADYAGYIYKPLQMQAQLEPGNVLDLKLSDPGWMKQRRLDDFVPDHDHLMHLYLLRWPAMDVVFHLHPQPAATGDFQLTLPSIPAGEYRLYADVVHATGFPETLVSSISVPYLSGRPLSGDDAEATGIALKPEGGAAQTSNSYKLPDGYSMIWKKPSVLRARIPEDFTFELLDAAGKPPQDMALYMGMIGHAAFVKSDGTVFAHIHPSGSVSMAALMMAEAQNQQGAQAAKNTMDSMPGMDISQAAPPNVVAFPYGFPSGGTYRIFIQMKHGNVVETGIFDAEVAP